MLAQLSIFGEPTVIMQLVAPDNEALALRDLVTFERIKRTAGTEQCTRHIAAYLGVTEPAVHYHLNHAYRRLRSSVDSDSLPYEASTWCEWCGTDLPPWFGADETHCSAECHAEDQADKEDRQCSLW
jgi:hypothetical protein